MPLLGIDVSHYQNEVDWFAVARGGVKFAFAKATEGNQSVDTLFARNWAGIQQAGLVRGTYHFGRPGRDAETQAVHFASVVGPLGFNDLPPVLDIEEADGHPADAVVEWTRRFIVKAEALFARRLMIYTGAFWRNGMANTQDPFFAERALWLAAYVRNPSIPGAWSNFAFWQYSEGQHNDPVAIPGVKPCDQSRFIGSEEDLAALCTGALPTPVGAGPEPASTPQNSGAAPGWPGTFFAFPKLPAVAGADVKEWQLRMVTLGFRVVTDGVYGPQSKAACIAFQKSHGLSADGIVGRATWNACFAL
jgi:lysozyme